MGYNNLVNSITQQSAGQDNYVASTKTYKNSRTGRTLKLHTQGGSNYIRFIMGGRYFDLFGNGKIGNATNISYMCGMQGLPTDNNIYKMTLGGYSTTPCVYQFNFVQNPEMYTPGDWGTPANLVRLLIIPDKYNIINDSNTFKTL